MRDVTTPFDIPRLTQCRHVAIKDRKAVGTVAVGSTTALNEPIHVYYAFCGECFEQVAALAAKLEKPEALT